MNLSHAPAVPTDGPDGEPVRTMIAPVTGRWLLAARIAWLALAVLVVGLLAGGAPLLFAQLHTVCPDPLCRMNGQLSSDGLRVLQDLGVSLDLYAAIAVALEAGWAIVWAGLGAFIFWRRSDERMALFVACFLLTGGAALANWLYDVLAASIPSWGR